MRIFIDVGGHFGETVESVLDPIYGFDLIYSFEPVKGCADKIREIKDDRVRVIEAGLLDKNTTMPIFMPGSEGASIFNDHAGLAPDTMRDTAFSNSVMCEFIKVSDFFKDKIGAQDEVVMKLNCEGSECDILMDLINSEEIYKIKNLLIDFDARKIPSQEHKIDPVMAKLKEINFKYYLPEDMQYGAGSHFGGIRQWLARTNEKKQNAFLSLPYHLKNILSKKHLPFYKFQVLKALPQPIVDYYYKHFK